MEHSDTKSTLLKYAGVFGILVPLLGAIVTAAFQYRQFVLENHDNNFRQVVAKLASDKPEERFASATNLGAYLQDPNYASQAEDILVNTTLIELDVGVLSAIRSSFEKQTNSEDRKDIIQKLIALSTMVFDYRAAMNQWRILSTSEYESSYTKFRSELGSLKQEYNVDIEKLPVQLIAEINNLKEKGRIKSQARRQFNEIPIHEEIIASFIKSMLNNSDKNPIHALEFFQNSLNFQAIVNVKLIDPKITNSALSRATMSHFDLDGVAKCLIGNTTFQNSLILDSTFTNCEFKQILFSGSGSVLKNVIFKDSSFDDVFFYLADISGSDFRSVSGLKPEFFYGALNYELARFSDENFIDEITKINETPHKFIEFLQNSSLSNSMHNSICDDLDAAKDVSCSPAIQ